MQITVWSKFLKRRNSMKRPTDAGTVINCTLKENCSVMNPIFELSSASYGLVEYVKWENNYYFVTDITMGINNYAIVHCTLDVLATWKDQILTNTAFVAYSSSNYSADIVDRRICNTVNTIHTRTNGDNIFGDSSIILTTISQDNGVASYAMPTENFYAIMQQILGDQSIIQDLKEMFGGVNQGLVSAIQVPFKYNSFPDAEAMNVYIGTYDTGTTGWRTRGYRRNTQGLEIPWTYTDFRRCADYTSINVNLPFIGCVPINPDSVMDCETINITMVSCSVTGTMSYRLDAKRRNLGVYTGSFGRSVPVATSQVDVLGALRGLTQTGGGAISTAIGAHEGKASAVARGAEAMIVGAANTAIALNTHSFSCIGGMGGNYGENIIGGYSIDVISRETRTEPDSITATNGRPCFKELPLNSLTGYVETIGFSFETNAISQVRDKINQMMDEGVFIE